MTQVNILEDLCVLQIITRKCRLFNSLRTNGKMEIAVGCRIFCCYREKVRVGQTYTVRPTLSFGSFYNTNSLRFQCLQGAKSIRRRHKALINKEKPAIPMDCWFSLFWWRWGELNPRPKALKQELLRAQQVFSGRRTSQFPSGQANRQACQSGSFMMHGTRKA